MQPAVLAAVVLPGAQDVDAVKRTQQLAGAPERLKNLHQASASVLRGTGSLSTAGLRKAGVSGCTKHQQLTGRNKQPLNSYAAQGWCQQMPDKWFELTTS